jgi:hypothetical protein
MAIPCPLPYGFVPICGYYDAWNGHDILACPVLDYERGLHKDDDYGYQYHGKGFSILNFFSFFFIFKCNRMSIAFNVISLLQILDNLTFQNAFTFRVKYK